MATDDLGRIRYEAAGPVCRITIDRPSKHNALHPQLAIDFHNAVRAFDADPDAWICVLAGTGRSFCAGRDLKFQATYDQHRPGGYDPTVKPFGLPATDKLMIGAARGAVRGAGGYFLLGCDIRVVSRTLTFAVNEVRTGVLGPYWIAATEKLPHPIAIRLAVLGEIFTAQQLEPYGVFTEVVDDDRLEAATERWIDALLQLPRHHAMATKRLMQQARGFTMEQAVAESAVRQQLDLLADTAEGATAFLEGRAPEFGRA